VAVPISEMILLKVIISMKEKDRERNATTARNTVGVGLAPAQL
jgi:hypothetical protein